MISRIGFIGFGEAGFTIGAGLASTGLARLTAYDIATDSSDRGPLIRQRAEQAGATLANGSADLAAVCDILLSTVTCNAAADAAQQTAPFLREHHTYVDLNSVCPETKREIEAIVAATGATFVEAAVMAPVEPYGHRVPMLIGGPAARSFVTLMAPLGMRLQAVDGRTGTAAAVKMCRSIVVKGLEALLAECVLGARRYGADEQVFASLQETWPGIDWKHLADYTMGRVVVHGERRAREMEAVAETLRAIGVEPIMAEATARRQQWSATLALKSHFAADGPTRYEDVLDILDRLQRA